MHYWLSYKEEQLLYEQKQKYRVKCQCGHTNTILNPRGYKLCSWCRNLVFLNPRIEFEYRLKQETMKEKRKLK